jgi:Ser/Thr protein kinase RdoA (MazF antagonist)
VTDLDAVAPVAERFVLNGPPVTVAPFGGGHINETFLVTTGHDEPGRNQYVVQRINRTVFAEPALLVENALQVSAHLRGHFVPEPVEARAGGWLVSDASGDWRCWSRVDGETVTDATPALAASAGNLLARFHAGLAGLDVAGVRETLPNFHDPARRLARLREVVAADPRGRVAGAGAEIEAAFTAAGLVGLADDLVARVPRRVAHNDAKLDNFLFRSGQAICLVDLDTVMPGAWLWDVGDLLRTAATSAAEDDPNPERAVVDPVRYRAIITGYLTGLSTEDASTGVEISPAELEALELAGAIVTYEQALRFLTDWIAGDVYYRISRPRQNLDRARAQLSLLVSMPGTVAP